MSPGLYQYIYSPLDHINPQPTCPPLPSNSSSLHSKMANPVIRWPNKWMSASLLYKDYTLPSATPSLKGLVVAQASSQPRPEDSLFEKSPLVLLKLHLNSRNLWTWMYPSRPSGIHSKRRAWDLQLRPKSLFFQGLMERLTWSLPWSTSIGLWMTGLGSFGQMRPRLID